VIASRYRLRRTYVAKLLETRGVKASARGRAAALGISPATAWRLFHVPEDDEPEFFAGPDAVNAVCASFPDESFHKLWEVPQ
jgi:hypothetical protein